MTDSHFYLGRAYDPIKKTTKNESVTYDPADLTTHAVVTGMTGSGKTGLCITLLEEAALAGIPAIIIDPKGDLTNLILHFPELAPQDFQPWIDSDLARRSGSLGDCELLFVAAALAFAREVDLVALHFPLERDFERVAVELERHGERDLVAVRLAVLDRDVVVPYGFVDFLERHLP